jgi:trimeric autotransporter adhesin
MSLSVVTTNNQTGSQTVTVRPVAVAIGQAFTLQLFGVSVSFTATAATAANVVAGLLAAINASSDPEWGLVDSELNQAGDALLITYSVTAGDLKIWRGDSPAVAQVVRVTPSNVETGDTYALTCNGKTVSVTATAATAANVSTLLAAAITAANLPEFNEFTPTVSGGVLVLTANTPGVPFTVTGNASNGSALGVVVSTVQNGRASVAGSNMVQTFSIPLTAAGTFRVVCGGELSSAIAVGAAAATVQTALQALSSIGSGNCTVSRTTDTNDNHYAVTFAGALAGVTVAQMIVTLTTTRPPIRTIQQGQTTGTPRNEIQEITMADFWDFDGVTSGYSYTLTINGQTTVAMDANQTAAALASNLGALSSIGFGNTGNVRVVSTGNRQTVEFTNAEGLANQSQLVASDFAGSMTMAITIPVTSTQLRPPLLALNEQQQVALTGSPTGGTFTLTFGANTTAAIAFDAAAATVQTALESLASIGSGNCVAVGPAGGPWLVEFTGTLAAADRAAMTGNGGSLSGGSAQGLTITTTTASGGPNHWDDPRNWLPVGVPADFDRVRFEFGSADVLYGLDQNTVTLTELEISSSYTGSIGLPRINANGYVEYRTRDLTLHCPSILIGHGNGAGSGKIQLNTLTTTVWMEIRNTGGSRESGVPALTWYGDNEATEIILLSGDLGVAIWSDQSATLNKVQQYGGSLRLDHSTINALYCPGQDVTAHETTLGGKPLEL